MNKRDNNSPENTKRILHERAAYYSQAEAVPLKPDEGIRVVAFSLGEEMYAVPKEHILEIRPLAALTPLPGAPSFLHGIIHFRGEILSILNLKKFLDIPERGLSDQKRIVIISGPFDVGLLVDKILETEIIYEHELQKIVSSDYGLLAQVSRGMTSEGLIVLDVEKLLAMPKLLIDENV